jgi:hypothetical protein
VADATNKEAPKTEVAPPRATPKTAPHVVADGQLVEEHGVVYLPGQELPDTGLGTLRRHELLAGGWVVDPSQKEG